MIQESTIVQLDDKLAFREVDNKLFLLTFDGRFFEFNSTGAVIVKSIDGKRDVRELAKLVQKEFQVDEKRAMSDVIILLNGMKKEGLVHFEDA